MIINASVGGTPGKDCGGFCRFCYFSTTDFRYLNSYSSGCKYCPPNQIGCDYCLEVINDILNGFKPLPEVLSQLKEVLKWYEFLGTLSYKDDKIVTCSCADIINYPGIIELVETLKDWGFQVHLGYTSGKAIRNEEMVNNLINLGLDEINFSVFSTNPQLRGYWMRDKTPQESLKALKLFCENIKVNVSTVVIPGVIDEEEIIRTCSSMEEWGVNTFILSRFVNLKQEGLIFNNSPILKDKQTQSYEEFIEMVKNISRQFSFKIVGTPFTDPETKGTPYMLSKRKYRDYLDELPEITSNATIITSKLSLKPLKMIFNIIAPNKVNIVAVDKEIGDLITREDLEVVELDEVKEKVILPGGALVHDKVASEIFNKDGTNRKILRGPASLFFMDIEGVNLKDLLEFEMKSFKSLIGQINSEVQ